jgi:membrane protein implicated in regulation of membrane protease activity
MFIGVFRAARPLRRIHPKEGAAMIEAVMLFLIGIGALLVSIGSMLRMAWLAIIIPTLIAGVAAYGLFALSRRRRTRQSNRRTDSLSATSRRAA